MANFKHLVTCRVSSFAYRYREREIPVFCGTQTLFWYNVAWAKHSFHPEASTICSINPRSQEIEFFIDFLFSYQFMWIIFLGFSVIWLSLQFSHSSITWSAPQNDISIVLSTSTVSVLLFGIKINSLKLWASLTRRKSWQDSYAHSLHWLGWNLAHYRKHVTGSSMTSLIGVYFHPERWKNCRNSTNLTEF